LSGQESVYNLKFLMRIENPDKVTQDAIIAGTEWLNNHKVFDIDIISVPDTTNTRGYDRITTTKPGHVMWARFYDLETEKPIFVGRDGQKRDEFMDIESERRGGYAYYGTWAKSLIEKDFPAWKKRVGIR